MISLYLRIINQLFFYMKRLQSLAVLAIALCLSIPTVMAQSPIMGFSKESSNNQLKLEEKYDKLLLANNLDEWMKYLSARPHHVGSPYDKKVVDYVAAKFKEWGYEVRIEKFDVLFPTPKLRLLEMTSPTKYKAKLIEPAIKGDESSKQIKEAYLSIPKKVCPGVMYIMSFLQILKALQLIFKKKINFFIEKLPTASSKTGYDVLISSTLNLLDFLKTSLTTLFAKETPEMGFGKGPINNIDFLTIIFYIIF